MSVDVTRIKAVKAHLIDYDRPCRKCGYNLMGLMSDTKCPECGATIKVNTKSLPRYSDNLVNAPLAWLRVLATGSLMLFIASIGLFVAAPVALWGLLRDLPVPGLVAMGFGVMWAVSVWIVTRPRPDSKAMVQAPTREWRELRWSARWTQVFWAVSAGLCAAAAKTGIVGLAWGSLGAFGIATLGLLPLCALLSNIAYWGSDTGLAGHLRACAWSVGFSAFLLGVHILNMVTGAVLVGGFIAAAIAALLLFFVAFPYFYMVFCCFHLQGMSRWAMLNHATAEAKDDRLRKRAERLAQTGESAKPPANAVDLAAFNLGDSDVTTMRGTGGVSAGGGGAGSGGPAGAGGKPKIRHNAPPMVKRPPGGSTPGGGSGSRGSG